MLELDVYGDPVEENRVNPDDKTMIENRAPWCERRASKSLGSLSCASGSGLV